MTNKIKPSQSDAPSLNPQSSILNPFLDIKEAKQLFPNTIQHRTINILQIVGEPIGGIRKHVHSLLLGLDDATFNQSYAYSTSKSDARFQDEIVEIRKKTHNRILPLTIKKTPGLRDIHNMACLRTFVRKHKIDIIHGHGAKGGLYARVVARLCKIKSVYTPHGGVVHKMFSPLMDSVYTHVERILLNSTDYVLFESFYTARAFKDKIGKEPKHWAVNYNGIPSWNSDLVAAEARQLIWDSGMPGIPQLGVFGMLRYQKGQQYAITAVHELKKRGVLVNLHVFGDGADLPKLVDLVHSLALDRQVIFHGDVSRPELYMSRMDIIIVPSLFESFGYVAVEAFSLKKPVIAFAVGGLKEVIDEKSGILVKSSSAVDLANAIKYLIEQKEAANQLALEGFKKFKECFTVDKMLFNTKNIYSQLMNPE